MISKLLQKISSGGSQSGVVEGFPRVTSRSLVAELKVKKIAIGYVLRLLVRSLKKIVELQSTLHTSVLLIGRLIRCSVELTAL